MNKTSNSESRQEKGRSSDDMKIMSKSKSRSVSSRSSGSSRSSYSSRSTSRSSRTLSSRSSSDSRSHSSYRSGRKHRTRVSSGSVSSEGSISRSSSSDSSGSSGSNTRRKRSFSPRDRRPRNESNIDRNASNLHRSKSRSSSRHRIRRRQPHDTEVVVPMTSKNRNDYTYQRSEKLAGVTDSVPPILHSLNGCVDVMQGTSGPVLHTPGNAVDPLPTKVDKVLLSPHSKKIASQDPIITEVTHQINSQTYQPNMTNLIANKRRERILEATAHHDKRKTKQPPMDHTILHRACIQFSSPLIFHHNSSANLGQSSKHPDLHDEVNTKLYVDIKKSICFIKCHLVYYPREIARALLWRIVEADGEEDRIGAWMLLDAGVRATNEVFPVVNLDSSKEDDDINVKHHHDSLTSHNLKRLERTGSIGSPLKEIQCNKGQQPHHPLDEITVQFGKELLGDTVIASRVSHAAEAFLRHITQFLPYLVLFCWGSRNEITDQLSQENQKSDLSLQHRMYEFIEGPLTKYSTKGGVNDLRVSVRGHGLLKEVTDIRNAMKNNKGFNSSMLAAMPLSATHENIGRVSEEVQLIAREAIQCNYRRILRGWKYMFSNELYKRIYHAVEDHFVALGETPKSTGTSVVTEEHKATFARFLLPTEKMGDSLSKLRRQEPRPRLVFAMLQVFGYPVWPKEAIRAPDPFTDNGGKDAIAHEETLFSWNVPVSMSDVYHQSHDGTLGEDSLNPRAQRWLKKAIEHKGGCVACDRWDHTSKQCPNIPSRQMVLDTSPEAIEKATKTIESYVDASLTVFDIEKGKAQLSGGMIANPCNSEERRQNLVATVLEVAFENLCKGVQVSDLLDALDTIQGHNSTGMERQALGLLSSYSLSPLKVLHLFPEKTQKMNVKAGSRNEFCTTSGVNALEYLRGERRYVEAEGLEKAFEVLHHRFCPPSALHYILSGQAQQDLRVIKQHGSYFFCLFKPGNMSIRAGIFNGNKVLLEVCERLIRIQHLIDPATLTLRSVSGPIVIGSSPQTEDPSLVNYDTSLKWDWYVAKKVLVRHGLIGSSSSQREYLGPKHAHEKLLSSISQKAFDEKKYGRESDFYSLKMAERLVRKHHYCQFCHYIGHSKRFCVSLLKLMLHKNQEWGVGGTVESARLCKAKLEGLLQQMKAEADSSRLKVVEVDEKEQRLRKRISEEERQLETAKKEIDILVSQEDISDEDLRRRRRVIEDRIDDHRRRLDHMDDDLYSIKRDRDMFEKVSKDKWRSARSIEDAITIISGDRRGDQGPGAGGFYPTNFAKAIDVLTETGLSLSEAHYCSEDCHALLMATNSLRYVNEIGQCASSKFPQISPFSNRFLADVAEDRQRAIRHAVSIGDYDAVTKVVNYRLDARYQHTPNVIISQQLCEDRLLDMTQYLKRVFYGATLHSLALPRTQDSANIRNSLIQIGEGKISEVSLISNSVANPLDVEIQFFMGLLGDDRAAYTFAAVMNYIKIMKIELKDLRQRKVLRTVSTLQSNMLSNIGLSRVRLSANDTNNMTPSSQHNLDSRSIPQEQSQGNDVSSGSGPYDAFARIGVSLSGIKRPRECFNDINASSKYTVTETGHGSEMPPNGYSEANDSLVSVTPSLRLASYSMPSDLSQNLMMKGYYVTGLNRGGTTYNSALSDALHQTQLGGVFHSQLSSDGDAGQVAGSHQVSPPEAAH